MPPLQEMNTPYIETYSDFWLTCLDPEWHKRTCAYWYTISSGSFAHTAFGTKDALMKWLDERGLKIAESLHDERGTYKVIQVAGTYQRTSYMDVEAFQAIIPLLEIYELDNGEYTLGKVTEQDGIRAVHYLNCNVKDRVVFPYPLIRRACCG